MSAPAIVTIALAVVAALTVVAFLIAIALVLKGVNARLVAVIRAVMTIVDKTEPVGPVVMSIDRNLGAAREVLETLLKRKLGAVSAPARSEPATRAAPALVRSKPARRGAPTPLRAPEPTPVRSEPVTRSEPARALAQVERAPTPPAPDTPAPMTPASGIRGTPGMPASAEPPVDAGAPAPGMPATARMPDEDDGGARSGLLRGLRGRLPGGPRERAIRYASGTPAPLPTRIRYERGPSSFGFEDEPVGRDRGDGASV